MSRQPFHRSDFTGSSGPGMAKLRAAKNAPWEAEEEPKPRSPSREFGLAAIKARMAAGEWREAILAAARFPDLGDQAEAIQRGREAIMRPSFMRQLRRDPDAAIEAAKAAMLKRWPL